MNDKKLNVTSAKNVKSAKLLSVTSADKTINQDKTIVSDYLPDNTESANSHARVKSIETSIDYKQFRLP